MWLFKKKVSLKQQVIDLGFNQLKLQGYLPFEIENFKITIRYNQLGGYVEIKVAEYEKWNSEILFLALTKYTFDRFKIAMIRCVNDFVLRSD